ncbi:MAG: hypothetical protein K9I29_07080 [Bacteroidales bacterium]|nr:hypothetical protein [Bacteroidales bacterium]
MAKIFSTHRRMIKGLDELDNAKKAMTFIVISKAMTFIVISSHLLSLMVIGSHSWSFSILLCPAAVKYNRLRKLLSK